MATRMQGTATQRTVPLEAAGVLVQALESIGGDAGRALAVAGLSGYRGRIDSGAPADIGRRPFAKLAQECVLAFHFHACRRDALRPHPVRNLRLMCTAMLACPDLATAIRVACEFQDMVHGDGVRLWLEVEDGLARVILNAGLSGRETGDMLVVMYALASFARMFGWLVGEKIDLAQVTLALPPSAAQASFNALLDLEPECDGRCNSIAFPARYLDRPVVRSFHELQSLFALFPFDLHPPEVEAQTIGDQARTVINSALLRGEAPPTLARLADMFGLTTATLRRRLATERVSLNGLRNGCRKARAVDLLSNTRLSMKEITDELSFSDVSSFRRAFKHWTGKAPSTYRRAMKPA